jgi:HupE / UreJ protein
MICLRTWRAAWAFAYSWIILLFAGAGILLTAAQPCLSHELRPAYLSLKEVSPQTFAAIFKVPMFGDMRLSLAVQLSGRNELLTPISSQATGDALIQTWRLKSTEPLAGQTVLIDGLNGTMTDALVRVEFLDGKSWTARLTPNNPSDVIPARQSQWSVALTFVKHGVEHILFGLDHLLFVASLMLIVRTWQALLKTITAFTVAHSITLTLAAFNLVNFPAAPVEAAVAMSILFVAVEIVKLERGETSLTISQPWIVAFAFGLLHGLGFAAALTSLGLPQGEVPLALLTFNVGVEIGQLAFVVAILIVVTAFQRIFALPRAAVVASAYGIGIVAAYWCALRIDTIFLKGL